MARTFDRRTLASELERARAAGWERQMRDAERAKRLPAGLLLAIASQETDMRDVVGDSGHGRGLFQIDDRSHAKFLSEHGAAGPGRKPPVAEAARYAAKLVRSNHEFGVENRVRRRDRLLFSLSAYNAGPGGALAGHREGDSDLRTTGGDYGRTVLRRHAIFADLLGGARPVRPLERGSRGRRVRDLKEKLAAWYGRHAPGAWERFRVTPGAFYGARVEAAVADFQARVGLHVDGAAGEDTIEALEADRKPKRG